MCEQTLRGEADLRGGGGCWRWSMEVLGTNAGMLADITHLYINIRIYVIAEITKSKVVCPVPAVYLPAGLFCDSRIFVA